MAVEAIGIYPNKKNKAIFNELAIYPTDSAPALKFRFATQSNTWIKANLWVTVDIVRKAGSEAIGGYSRKGDAGCMDVALSSFTAVGQVDGNYVWELALSNALLDDVRTLLGTLTYSSRSYDAIRLNVEVRVVWGNADGEYEKSSQVCYIGFKPTYTATGAQYDPDGLAIFYTASGWNRPNDRWENNAIYCASKPLVAPKSQWGTVGGAGKLTIPAGKLRFIPNSGDTLSGSIRMCGSWQDEGSELGKLNLAGVTVTNLTQIRTPTITAVAQSDDSGVLVTVGAGTGTGTAATRIDVNMVGSTYSMDRASLAPGDSYLFRAVPSGVSTTWQAVGIAESGGIEYASEPAQATAAAIHVDGIVLTPENGTEIAIPYNATMNGSAKPEAETVKLAGRDRPTVGFGEGGTAKWSISGKIVVETMGGLKKTDPDDVLALPYAGICMLRDENGNRTQLYVTDASVSRAVGGGGGLRDVSISAEEVA